MRSLTSSCAAWRPSACWRARGQVTPEFLAVVEGTGKALLQVADLAAAAGDELVHLTAAVAAHLNFEGVFVQSGRQEITVFIHGFPDHLCLSRRGRCPESSGANGHRVVRLIRQDRYISMRAQGGSDGANPRMTLVL